MVTLPIAHSPQQTLLLHCFFSVALRICDVTQTTLIGSKHWEAAGSFEPCCRQRELIFGGGGSSIRNRPNPKVSPALADLPN